MQPWWGILLFLSIVCVIGLIASLITLTHEQSLVRRGILKDKDETTIDDIIDLERNGNHIWALKRLRQRPEYRKLKLKEAKEQLRLLVEESH